MKKLLLPILAVLLFSFFAGCPGPDPVDTIDSIRSYGGSIPIGDLVTIYIDSAKSKVKCINNTTDEDSGWLSYTVLPKNDQHNSGFSILKKAVIDETKFVIFAEYPNAAVIYQMFEDGETIGEPVYVVSRSMINKNTFKDKAYNWMKFLIDATDDEESDMNCGFVGFDTDTDGLMYGASYSHNSNINGDINKGLSDINTGGVVSVANMTANAANYSNELWPSGDTSDLADAVSLIGTPSGSIILDFGMNTGGGMGIAIPQSDIELTDVDGTYFAMVYFYEASTDTTSVDPMKIVVSSTGIQVFNYSDSISTGTPVFDENLTKLAEYAGGPDSKPVCTSFADYAGNNSATSTTIQDANNCRGAYLAGSEDAIVNVMFDPNGKFLTFTMFMGSDPDDRSIGFGFGIRDNNYTDPQ